MANLTMVTIAFRNPSAPAAEDAYQEGLKHDMRAAEARASAELGWHVSLDVCDGRATGECSVQVVVRDRAGAPVKGLRGSVVLRRFDDVAFDREEKLGEAGGGVYLTNLTVTRGGLYEVGVRLEGPGGATWVTRQRTRLENDT